MAIRLLLICYLLLTLFCAAAQNTIGLPEIINYSKSEYHGGAQTRQATQSQNGIMYFANDEGLLVFNGAKWKTFPLANLSRVRCLEFGDDNKLYVGGQDEFGFFQPNANGNLEYHSLKSLIPLKDRSFADVWEISKTGNSIFFQTSKEIFQYSNGAITVYKDDHWVFMGLMGSQLVAQNSSGLLKYNNGKWYPFSAAEVMELPQDYVVTSFTTIGKDSVLMTTLKNGIYIYSNHQFKKMVSPLLSSLEKKNLYASLMVNENQLAIGSNLDGLYIITKQGALVRNFSLGEGLQDNNIQGIFLDSQKNLWLGLHNGIDFIPYNNAVKHIRPYNTEGAGFSSLIFKEELFIGTSVGVYKVPANKTGLLCNIKAYFSLVKNTEGDAWNISQVNNKLLIGHNDGAFELDGGQLKTLDRSTGYWNFLPFNSIQPASVMVAGTYNGIQFFKAGPNSFTKLAAATSESARFVVVSNNKAWYSHPYKGVYNVSLHDTITTIKQYGKKEGVASSIGNYLFSVRNRLVLTTENGIFEYNPVKDIFTPSTFYNKHLPAEPLHYLKEDTEGNVWFVFDKKIGVLDLTTSTPQVIYFPELTNKMAVGFEHINPIDKRNILIGGEKGFYHINYEQYKLLSNPLHVQVTAVSAINQNDSILYGGFTVAQNKQAKNKPPKFKSNFNSLHFEFASAMYGQLSTLEYSYFLEGFDAGWIAFNNRTEKDYTNLPPGRYTFKVKARNNLGNISPVSEYSFIVLPPWYKTTLAYIIYFLAGILILVALYRFLRKKFEEQQRLHEEEQRQLQYLHKLEMENAESELIQLRNEKLEAEIISKNTELASATMHLVQKTDVLLKIKEQMIKLKNTPADDDSAIDLKKILRTLNDENMMEEQWQQFSIHFDAVHHNFLHKLKKQFPNLSPNDHKLCAYLKMNLSTKEIAQLMNISVRGVEISRYRLRKKLGVESGVNLSNFFDRIN